MLFHYIFNSFVVFCALAVLVEFVLFALRIKNARLRTFCRALPFFKLPFDFLFFGLYGESLFINLNPFSCEVVLQQFVKDLFFGFFKTDLSPGERLIIPQYIAMKIPPNWLKGFLIGTVGVSISAILYKSFQFLRSCATLKSILRSSLPCTREIVNVRLQSRIASIKAVIVTSRKISIPLAANKRHIVFPENSLHDFSQEEFEAVVAHELEHLRWKDPFLKLFCASLRALLWWIPIGWWLRRLDADLENASDAGVRKYGIDTHCLASAIVKVVAGAHAPLHQKLLSPRWAATCELASSGKTRFKRLKCLLEERDRSKKCTQLNSWIGAGLCLMGFMSFWMC